MEITKEELEFIKGIIKKNAEMEVQLDGVKTALKQLRVRGISKTTVIPFIEAVRFIVGEEEE